MYIKKTCKKEKGATQLNQKITEKYSNGIYKQREC